MAETLSDKRLAAAESAALAPAAAPAAPPKPVTQGNGVTGAQAEARMKELTAPTPAPAPAPSLMQRVKGLVGLKAGGPVPGKGSGDKVPLMAEPGEFMVRKAAVPAANAAAKKAGFKNLDHLNKSAHNPDNRLPMSAKHKPGSRGAAMAGMKCGGKVK